MLDRGYICSSADTCQCPRPRYRALFGLLGLVGIAFFGCVVHRPSPTRLSLSCRELPLHQVLGFLGQCGGAFVYLGDIEGSVSVTVTNMSVDRFVLAALAANGYAVGDYRGIYAVAPMKKIKAMGLSPIAAITDRSSSASGDEREPDRSINNESLDVVLKVLATEIGIRDLVVPPSDSMVTMWVSRGVFLNARDLFDLLLLLSNQELTKSPAGELVLRKRRQ